MVSSLGFHFVIQSRQAHESPYFQSRTLTTLLFNHTPTTPQTTITNAPPPQQQQQQQ